MQIHDKSSFWQHEYLYYSTRNVKYVSFGIYFLWEDNEEHSLIKERKFIVGEKTLKDLIKRKNCHQCDAKIQPCSVQEGEHIAAGIKFKYKCVVSVLENFKNLYSWERKKEWEKYVQVC